MVNKSKLITFLCAALASLSFPKTGTTEPAAKLTVVIDGLRHQNGQVCLRIFADGRGFPQGDTSEVKSGCTKITGHSVIKQFYGLKPGTYAVAVLDDEYGDHRLHKNFLGIPEEGFGISNNPTVSVLTGTPRFQDASFSVRKDTTIRIVMKYSLDP